MISKRRIQSHDPILSYRLFDRQTIDNDIVTLGPQKATQKDKSMGNVSHTAGRI